MLHCFCVGVILRCAGPYENNTTYVRWTAHCASQNGDDFFVVVKSAISLTELKIWAVHKQESGTAPCASFRDLPPVPGHRAGFQMHILVM